MCPVLNASWYPRTLCLSRVRLPLGMERMMEECILGTRPTHVPCMAPEHMNFGLARPLPLLVTLSSPGRHLSYPNQCTDFKVCLLTSPALNYEFNKISTIQALPISQFLILLIYIPENKYKEVLLLCREGTKHICAHSPALHTDFMSGQLFQGLYVEAVRTTIFLILCDIA